MSSFGRQEVGSVGTGVRLSVDGNPEYKFAGVTIDWSVVAAVEEETTIDDGVIIAEGEKYLPRGQVINRISAGQNVTATITGTPTGGTFTITVGGQTTSALAYNAASATVQTAVRALSTVGGTNATVTGSAGGPYTIVLHPDLGDQVITASGASLTGGTSPGVTVTETSGGDRTNLYGPYDPDEDDGRQTLTPGEVFVLNETVREGDIKSDHPVAIYGGKVWKARLKATTTTHTLADGPTYTELLAVLPRLQLVS